MSKRTKALRYYRSYKPQGPVKKLIFFLLRLIVLVFLFFQIFQTFFIQVYIQHTPNGEIQRFIASPLVFGPEVKLFNYRFPALRTPARGDLVTAEIAEIGNNPWYMHMMDAVVSFFTLNKRTLLYNRGPYFGSRYRLYRVLGLPGDTVKLEEFHVKIMIPEKDFFLDENELVQQDYTPDFPDRSSSISGDLPFSGDQPPITIGKGEYLLVQDERSTIGSASQWKASPLSRMKAKVMLSFWPKFSRL